MTGGLRQRGTGSGPRDEKGRGELYRKVASVSGAWSAGLGEQGRLFSSVVLADVDMGQDRMHASKMCATHLP